MTHSLLASILACSIVCLAFVLNLVRLTLSRALLEHFKHGLKLVGLLVHLGMLLLDLLDIVVQAENLGPLWVSCNLIDHFLCEPMLFFLSFWLRSCLSLVSCDR